MAWIDLDEPAGEWVDLDTYVSPPKTEPEKRGVIGFAKDTAIDLAKGVVGFGESVAGIGSLVSFGAIGKGLEAIGYDPKQTSDFLSGFQSDARQQSEKAVAQETGFFGQLKALGTHPDVLIGKIVEALPGTIGAGAVAGTLVKSLAAKAAAEATATGLTGTAATDFIAGRVKDAAFKIAAVASGAEGAQTAGSIAEAGRQAGREWSDYVAPAIAAGLGTAAIGMVSGKIGQKLGIGDLETDVAVRAAGVKGAGAGTGGFLSRIGKEFIKEGALEEMTQSAQEQAFQNIATGKPVSEGVEQAAASGLIVGGAMGGGHAAIAGGSTPAAKPAAPDRTADILNAQDVNTAIAASQKALDEVAAPVEQTVDPLIGSQPEPVNDEQDFNDLLTSETRNLQVMDAQLAQDRQKQSELDAIPAIAADQNIVQSALQRAATLEAPTALELAFQRAKQEPTQAPEPLEPATPEAPTEPVAEPPRLIDRAPGLLPMSLARAEQVAAKSPDMEVVRFPNINRDTGQPNGKFSYTVISKAQDVSRTGDVRGLDSGTDGGGGNQPGPSVLPGSGNTGSAAPAMDAGSAGSVLPRGSVPAVPAGDATGLVDAVGRELRQRVESAEPMTQEHVDAIEAYQAHLVEGARKSLDAGDMPVFQNGRVTVAIGPSAQSVGMFQATRYNDTGAIGDSQYKTIEQAIVGESLMNAERLPSEVAAKRMAGIVDAESAYQAKRDAFNVENAQPRANPQAQAPRAEATAPGSIAKVQASDSVPVHFKSLLLSKSTKIILDDGKGRVLYDVKVTPEFRNKNFVNGRLPSVKGLELVHKEDVTKNPSDNGWVLIDNRAQIASREPAAAPAPAPQLPAAAKPSPKPKDAGHIGANNIPIAEGGKPFKTKKGADLARKMNPMLRAKQVQGGYVLVPKSEKELAAEAIRVKRLSQPRTSPPGEPIPAHAFIASEGGLSKKHQNDLGVDGNQKIGNRWLFSALGRGLSIEQATEKLIQEQYLPEGASHTDAYNLIRKSLTQPQYNADGIERIAEAEQAARFDDYLTAQMEDAPADPFGDLDDLDITVEDATVSGYDELSDPIKIEVNALLAQADALGIDTDTIKEEAYEATRNGPEQDYFEAQRSQLQATIDQGNGSRSNQADPRADSEQGREAAISRSGEGGGADAGQQGGTAEPILTSLTQADILAQQDRAEQAEKQSAAQRLAAEKQAAQDEDRKRIAKASEAAASTFTLGGDAMDNLTGQGSIFDAPAVEQASDSQPITPDAAANMQRGDIVRDSNGVEYYAWSARFARLDVVPMENGKPVVYSGSTIRFALNQQTRDANPEYRSDDLYLVRKAEQEPAKPAAEMSASELLRAAADKMDAEKAGPAQARRTNPTQTIEFKNPIVGPSGEKLVSYTWQWKPFEYVDKTGEERTGKLSDWDKSAGNVDTGREVVHQFTVENKDGETRIVSAESAIAALGYADKASDGSAKSAISAAKTLARNKMQLAELESALSAFMADQTEVNRLAPPEVTRGDGGWWSMGDSKVRQTNQLFPNSKPDELLPERMKVLEDGWRSNRLAERGWNLATENTLKEGIYNTKAQIKRAQAKLDAMTPAAAKPENQGAGKDAADPSKTKQEAEQALWERINAGTVTPDEFKAGFENWLKNKDAILSEMLAMKKDELLAKISPYMRARYKSETKPEIAEALWRDGLGSYGLQASITYSLGKDSYANAVRRLVEATDADRLTQYAAEVQIERDQMAQRIADRVKAIADPQTLADYEALIRSQAKEAGVTTLREARMLLTPEQRAKYDELAADKARSDRNYSKEVQQAVKVAGQMVDAAIIETKHTQKGHDLFVVRLAERVERGDYDTLNASAKKMGGYYSSFRGRGAVPGFQFTERATAEAFVKLANGDSTDAQAAADSRRDAFADDRSQSAAERLTEMADRLDANADESLNADRKANTARRAAFASAAEAAARSGKAMAKTMRNIAQALTSGTAKYLDRIRTKTQIDALQGYVNTAHYEQLKAKYPTYAEQEKRKGQPPDSETADFAEFPQFTAYRSDLASLARQMIAADGTKLMGQRLMKVADDVSDAFTKFAKENTGKLMRFRTTDGGLAAFPSQASTQAAIDRSGYRGKAIPFMVKRGEWTIITSPSEAIAQGLWTGDGDKRITLTADFGSELVEKIGKANRRGAKVSVPWQFESAHDKRKMLARMGIETPAELRAALREFIGLREQAAEADRVKVLERAMVGRKNDGLDFFPTPESVADEMIAAADIQPDMAVLEPSAGMGHIADRIRAAGAEPDVIELSADRKELLEAKGFTVVGSDFMEIGNTSAEQKELDELLSKREAIRTKQMNRLHDGGATRARTTTSNAEADKVNERIVWLREQIKNATPKQYDRIVMNPPFSDGRDMAHVQHAYTLLKPGGRLVALMGESAFTNQSKRATEFRAWLEQVGGTDEKLAEGTFLDPSLPVNTGANARMVVIEKPAGDLRLSFAGQRAATADKFKLDSAQARIDDGEDAETVRKETGWSRRVDGKWRFEISDADAKLKGIQAVDDGIPIYESGTVGEYLDHPALFAAYPAIRNIDLIFQVMDGASVEGSFEAGTAGDAQYYGRSTEIKVQAPTLDRALSTLLHEIQHGIQNIEGFATGGKPESMASLLDKEQFDAMVDKDDALTSEYEALKRQYAGIPVDQVPQDVADRVRRLRGEINAVRNTGWRQANNPFSRTQYTKDELFSGYQRLAGEVEARNTQARQKMTDAQRAATPPSATADVADADVIVTFNGKDAQSAPMPANIGSPAPNTPIATIRESLTKAYGKLSSRLESKGLLSIHQTQDEAMQAAAQARADVRGTDVADELAGMQNGGTNQSMTNSNVVGNQGGRSADDNSPGAARQSLREVDLFGNGSRVQYFDDNRGLFYESQRYPSGKVGWKAGEVIDGQTQWLSDKDYPSMEDAIKSVRSQRAVNTRKANFQEKYGDIPNAWKGEAKKVAMAVIDAGHGVDRFSSSTQTNSKYLHLENGTKIRLADHDLPGAYDQADHEFRYGGDIADLVDRIQNESPAPTSDGALDLKRSADGRTQGFYDPITAKSFLIADNLTSDTAPGVLIHEIGIHAAADGTIDPLHQRAAELVAGDTSDFMRDVANRMDAAGESSPEEAAAYIAEAYENNRLTAPKSVRQWIADYIAAIRGWLYKKGILIASSDLTPADIAAIARANARAVAEGGAQALEGGLSLSSAGDQTLTAAFKRWFGSNWNLDAILFGQSSMPESGPNSDAGNSKPLANLLKSETFSLEGLGGFEIPTQRKVLDGVIALGDNLKVLGSVIELIPVDVMNILARKNIAPETLFRDHAMLKELLSIDSDGSVSTAVKVADALVAAVARVTAKRSSVSSNPFGGTSEGNTAAAASSFDELHGVSIKPIGNNGQFDPTNPDIRRSRAAIGELKQQAQSVYNAAANTPGKLGWWHKTVGTQYNLAQRSPEFKRVYDAVQSFLNDVSFFATESADLAPTILPKLENWRDIAKSPLSAADTKAIAAPIFEGTLTWMRDESGKPVKVADMEEQAKALTSEQKAQRLLRNNKISANVLKMWQGMEADKYDAAVNSKYDSDMLKAGVVWTPSELQSLFKLTGEKQDDGTWSGQIGLYQEFRKATDKSLTHLALSDMLYVAGDDADPIRDAVLASATPMEAAETIQKYLLSVAEYTLDRNDELLATADTMIDKAAKVQDLIDRGYAPLSRFGNYTLDVVDDTGERVYFGLFEGRFEAEQMAKKMREMHPGANVTQGTLSEQSYKLFSGVSPETVALFGGMMGLDGNPAYQEYIKLAKSSRSALKRLIERKGIAGFSEDAGRVLAGFVYSNARQTSQNLHAGEMSDAANAIPQQQGELKDHAVNLVEYIKNPQQEAQQIRGLLFAQYIGGSVASAMVNMTQPLTMTLPWLSQYGGITKAAKQMAAAVVDANKKTTGDTALDAALKRAEEDGTVSPQEVHDLMRQAQGKGALQSGDGSAAGDAYAKSSNMLSRVSFAWGKLFSAAEQFNRRSTFIAAYRTAVEQGMGDPSKFAEQAIAETQGIYNKGNKPEWARGSVGSILFTFKQYSVAYVEMLSRMATAGKPGSPERAAGQRSALYALGVLMLLSGAGGLPGTDDLDDLISGLMQAIGYNFDSKSKRKAFLVEHLGTGGADFVERGLSGLPGAPIDVSGRLGLGNLIPGTGLLTKKQDHTRDVLEFVGPAGDLFKRGFESAGKVVTGDIMGKNGAVATLAPKAMQNLFQAADMEQMGMYRDQTGKKVIDTDSGDALAKALGFQPGSVKRSQDASFEVQRMVGLNKINESRIVDKWAQGLFEKDPEKVQEARDELAQWNKNNPESPIRVKSQQIFSRVANMRMTKQQRIAKTAPAEIRREVYRELAQQ